MRVFAIFAHEDRAFFENLRRDLMAAKIQLQSASEIVAPGDSIIQSITRAIRETDAVIVLISTASERSAWVASEAALALSAAASKRILPVLVHREAKPPLVLQDLQYLDLSTPEAYRSNFPLVFSFLAQPPRLHSNDLANDARRTFLRSQMHALELERAVRAHARQVWTNVITSAVFLAGLATMIILGGGFLWVEWSKGLSTGLAGFVAGVLVALVAEVVTSSIRQRSAAQEEKRAREFASQSAHTEVPR